MNVLVFILGGCSYGLIEILFRGYTHWSMVLTGGAIVLTLYLLLPDLLNMNLLLAAASGALIITTYEFFIGCLVNLWFKWEVWDYSNLPGNILGQICPQFTALWFCLCLAFFVIVKYNKSIFF
ncbi:MAG: hypothetical protein IKU44_03525 [Firmicutes bacterium]|nr:hypothetical protein [Bacillota bacterium]